MGRRGCDADPYWKRTWAGTLPHPCNPRLWESNGGRSGVWGQFGLIVRLSQKKKCEEKDWQSTIQENLMEKGWPTQVSLSPFLLPGPSHMTNVLAEGCRDSTMVYYAWKKSRLREGKIVTEDQWRAGNSEPDRRRKYQLNGMRCVQVGSYQHFRCTSSGHSDGATEDQDEEVSRTNHEWSCAAYKEFELYPIDHYKPLKNGKQESRTIRFLFQRDCSVKCKVNWEVERGWWEDRKGGCCRVKAKGVMLI